MKTLSKTAVFRIGTEKLSCNAKHYMMIPKETRLLV